jgi:hypothetical protein
MPRRSMSNDSSTSSILGISRDRISVVATPQSPHESGSPAAERRQVLAAAVELAAGDYAKAMITPIVSAPMA